MESLKFNFHVKDFKQYVPVVLLILLHWTVLMLIVWVTFLKSQCLNERYCIVFSSYLE